MYRGASQGGSPGLCSLNAVPTLRCSELFCTMLCLLSPAPWSTCLWLQFTLEGLGYVPVPLDVLSSWYPYPQSSPSSNEFLFLQLEPRLGLALFTSSGLLLAAAFFCVYHDMSQHCAKPTDWLRSPRRPAERPWAQSGSALLCRLVILYGELAEPLENTHLPPPSEIPIQWLCIHCASVFFYSGMDNTQNLKSFSTLFFVFVTVVSKLFLLNFFLPCSIKALNASLHSSHMSVFPCSFSMACNLPNTSDFVPHLFGCSLDQITLFLLKAQAFLSSQLGWLASFPLITHHHQPLYPSGQPLYCSLYPFTLISMLLSASWLAFSLPYISSFKTSRSCYHLPGEGDPGGCGILGKNYRTKG